MALKPVEVLGMGCVFNVIRKGPDGIFVRWAVGQEAASWRDYFGLPEGAPLFHWTIIKIVGCDDRWLEGDYVVT